MNKGKITRRRAIGGLVTATVAPAVASENSATARPNISVAKALAEDHFYANEVTGLAAVSDGDYFAVSGTGDIYAVLYRRMAGNAVQQARFYAKESVDTIIATRVANTDLASTDDSKGAALTGFKQSDYDQATDRTVRDKLLEIPISPADFRNDLAAAFAVAATTGRELRLDGSYTLPHSITVNAKRPMTISATARTKILYVGGDQISSLIRINCFDNDVHIIGKGLIIDCQYKANCALEIRNILKKFPPNIQISGITTRKNRLNSNIFSLIASGIQIWGPFHLVRVRDTHVEDVTRAAGIAGGVTQGFVIARDAANGSVLHLDVEGVSATNITTSDPAGTPACVDCDGFAFFQDFQAGATFIVRNIRGFNCQGRTLKAQPGCVPIIENFSVYRNIRGISAPGGSKEIALQYGEGIVRNGEITYEGTHTHASGTVPLGFYSGNELPSGFGLLCVDGVTIFDRTTGTDRINFLISAEYNLQDSKSHHVSIRNLKIIGNEARRIISLGSLGQQAPARVDIDGFTGSLATAADGGAIAVANGALGQLIARVSSILNTGGEAIPVIAAEDGRSLGNVWGQWCDGGGNVNVQCHHGANAGVPGLFSNMGMIGFPDGQHSVVGGIQSRGTRLFKAGEIFAYAPFGYEPGCGIFTITPAWRGKPGLYACSNTSPTISVISAGTSIILGDGIDPPLQGGQVGAWIDPITGKLHIKNGSDGARFITVQILA